MCNKLLYLVKYRIKPNVNVLKVYVLACNEDKAKGYIQSEDWFSEKVLILGVKQIDKLLSVPKAYRDDRILNLDKSIAEYFQSLSGDCSCESKG